MQRQYSVKYAFIKENRVSFCLIRMCHVFGVSSSGYYGWLKRPESTHSIEDNRLSHKIKLIHNSSRRNYGARRIKAELEENGEKVSRPRIVRLMKKQGLEYKNKRKFRVTTNSKHSLPVAPNIINRKFNVSSPNTVYVGDITFIPTAEGWLYLSVLIDLFSRMIVGWSMSSCIDSKLVNDALNMPILKRRPSKGLIVHSDRGSQYASHFYQKNIKHHNFVCSMSRKGDCWDNAPAESFFSTLKKELIHHRHYKTREEAQKDIFEYIEVFYNRQRRHSSIGNKAPVNYEKEYLKAA